MAGICTMTVLPLYCMMWHDLPTSFPPPSARNISSSEGSIGSSTSGVAASCFRLAAMVDLGVSVVMKDYSESSGSDVPPKGRVEEPELLQLYLDGAIRRRMS